MLNSLKSLYNRILKGWSDFKVLASKDISGLWSQYKGILLLFGAAVLAMKFRQWLIDLLVNSAKQLYQSTQKKSLSLQTTENKDNKAADTLVQQAQNLPTQEKPIQEDWYKNQK